MDESILLPCAINRSAFMDYIINVRPGFFRPQFFRPQERTMKKIIAIICLVPVIAMTCACGGIKQPFKNLAKTNIDMVSDIHILALRTHMQELSLALYKNNVNQLGKVPNLSLENRISQIIDHSTDIHYREADYLQSTEAIELAFAPDYRGDRVFVLLLGINSMLKYSYNNLEELFMFDDLDPQRLYDSARNLERVAWRLRNEIAQGRTLIALEPTGERSSIEDTLIRMASIQDMMAEIIASKTQRMVSTAVQNTATTMLIPIGW